MTRNELTMNFIYDANGSPMVLVYNGVNYYYMTNAQGDVTAILDSTGAPVVTYIYDAYGQTRSIGGSMASTMGAYNPLRYRGYVWDTDTGLFYLQSRYYSPKMGRFINADAFTSTGQGMIGNNMFAYCGNNPINYVDPTGHLPVWVIPAIKGIIGGTTRAITAYIGGEEGEGLLLAFMVGAGAAVIDSFGRVITAYDVLMTTYEYSVGKQDVGYGALMGILTYGASKITANNMAGLIGIDGLDTGIELFLDGTATFGINMIIAQGFEEIPSGYDAMCNRYTYSDIPSPLGAAVMPSSNLSQHYQYNHINWGG